MPIPIRENYDPVISFSDQLQSGEDGPVVMMNTFTVEPKDVDLMLEVWVKDSEWMKAQPGWISAQLHIGTGESYTLLNYSVWETAADLDAARKGPGFIEAVSGTPATAIARPHLFRTVAVEGVCVE